MRIISGFLKGKVISYLKNSTTRPLKDNVRENIFNILNHSNLFKINLINSKVLDVYSGFGSFGLECLSRSVKKVTFIDRNSEAIKVLKKNLEKFSLLKKVSIEESEVETFLKNKKKEKYNIFFLDPPYADKTFVDNLNTIKQNRMYEDKHIVIIHRETNTLDSLEDHINIISTRKYGRSKIVFGLFTE